MRAHREIIKWWHIQTIFFWAPHFYHRFVDTFCEFIFIYNVCALGYILVHQREPACSCVLCSFLSSLLPWLYATGITLLPCGEDHVQDILAGQETNFTCTAEGQVQWRWQLDKTVTSKLVAQCDIECTPINTFDGLFSSHFIDAHTSSIIVKAVNNTRVYQDVRLVNGSLECTAGEETKSCGLNYVCKLFWWLYSRLDLGLPAVLLLLM